MKPQADRLVLAMIERFNYVSSWIATRICMTEKPRDRTKLIAKLINVAYHLKQLNNFNGLMEICSGLNRCMSNKSNKSALTKCSAPVYRLRASFAEVDKLKDGFYMKIWQELNALTSSDKAYAVLRKEIKSITPPCIPYLGMYLTDLTFVEVPLFKRVSNIHLLIRKEIRNFSQSINSLISISGD